MNEKTITDSSHFLVPLPQSNDPLNYLLIFFKQHKTHVKRVQAIQAFFTTYSIYRAH